MMTNKFLTTVAFLAVSVFAGESIHLVNCEDNASRVYYYSTDGNYGPSDSVTVSQGGFIHWEGNVINAYYSDSGVTYTSRINSNGQTVGNYKYAGSGSNGYHNFNCYKDDNHVIAQTVCHSIYYCFDA